MSAYRRHARRDRIRDVGARSGVPSIVIGNLIILGTLWIASLALADPADADRADRSSGVRDTIAVRIPETMRAEHEEIHAELVRATKLAGPVGIAARELAAVLHPHFVREEQIALPPLGLLEPLSRGELTAAMREVLPMTDSLRVELPRMLAEHVAIRAATVRLRDVARAEGNTEVVKLAEALAMHARGEEEIFYPAAVLVGDLVRTRSRR